MENVEDGEADDVLTGSPQRRPYMCGRRASDGTVLDVDDEDAPVEHKRTVSVDHGEYSNPVFCLLSLCMHNLSMDDWVLYGLR